MSLENKKEFDQKNNSFSKQDQQSLPYTSKTKEKNKKGPELELDFNYTPSKPIPIPTRNNTENSGKKFQARTLYNPELEKDFDRPLSGNYRSYFSVGSLKDAFTFPTSCGENERRIAELEFLCNTKTQPTVKNRFFEERINSNTENSYEDQYGSKYDIFGYDKF